MFSDSYSVTFSFSLWSSGKGGNGGAISLDLEAADQILNVAAQQSKDMRDPRAESYAIGGDKRAALGLAGIALRSVARSTIASLWSVEDRATATFMEDFYQELAKTGTTKAEALRNAQLILLKNPSFTHPFYWSPFVLIGNWL